MVQPENRPARTDSRGAPPLGRIYRSVRLDGGLGKSVKDRPAVSKIVFVYRTALLLLAMLCLLVLCIPALLYGKIEEWVIDWSEMRRR